MIPSQILACLMRAATSASATGQAQPRYRAREVIYDRHYTWPRRRAGGADYPATAKPTITSPTLPWHRLVGLHALTTSESGLLYLGSVLTAFFAAKAFAMIIRT